MRILLVEDNEMNRDMLSRRLSRKGYQVLLATSGEQGLHLARSESPDIILMDVGLPGMDGWEATRQLKHSPGTQNIPVIALTAHALNSDRELAAAAGCDEYETKPIDFQKLLSKIDLLTGQIEP
jgi:two-component system cell cycle response regulator DivK